MLLLHYAIEVFNRKVSAVVAEKSVQIDETVVDVGRKNSRLLALQSLQGTSRLGIAIHLVLHDIICRYHLL